MAGIFFLQRDVFLHVNDHVGPVLDLDLSLVMHDDVAGTPYRGRATPGPVLLDDHLVVPVEMDFFHLIISYRARRPSGGYVRDMTRPVQSVESQAGFGNERRIIARTLHRF